MVMVLDVAAHEENNALPHPGAVNLIGQGQGQILRQKLQR